MAGAVAGIGWETWALCRGCPGGIARAKVGLDWGGPGALCREGVLAGQLKLKWVIAGASQGTSWRGCSGKGSWRQGQGMGQDVLGVFCTGGPLEGQLLLRWARARRILGLSMQRVLCEDR